MTERNAIHRPDVTKAKNPDLRASLAGMRRAAALARQIAIQTDTDIVLVRDGKPGRISAAELRNGWGQVGGSD